MKKKVLLRALLGAPIGLSIGFLVTLLVSAGFGDGKFYPVTPELTALCGTELRAVAVQTAVLLLCGAVWAAASVIWEGVEPPAPDGHASAGLFAFGAPGGVLYALDAAHGRRNFGLLRHFSRNLRRNLAGKLSFRPRPHPRDERKAPWERIKSPVPERRHRISSISFAAIPQARGRA